MPKEMIDFKLDRKGNEPWGFVIVGGKDQVSSMIFTLILIWILIFTLILIIEIDIDIYFDIDN